MKKARLLFWGQLLKIFEASAPESSHFGILREWPRHLAQRGRRGVLRGQFGYARVGLNSVVLIVAFLGLGLLFIVVGRWITPKAS